MQQQLENSSAMFVRMMLLKYCFLMNKNRLFISSYFLLSKVKVNKKIFWVQSGFPELS